MGGNSIFTGIVEEIGTVKKISRGRQSFQISIQAAIALEDVKIGDSIAVNGVCLTVTEHSSSHFAADVMPETYERTTLKSLNNGSRVNLERALRLADRLGGHLVQGHVDGVGTIISKIPEDIAIAYRIKAGPEILKYVVAKGSIAVDGISLTVIEVREDSFTVSLIPHTSKLTVLGWKGEGDRVNLETDIVGRYIEKLITRSSEEKSTKGINYKYLAENGFI
ncbi:riboflavin synthase eubacterial/eukaryotic [hydrocarbon metagenome]|uniref:Riboflavin synthase n=1 Tax=hydrocarbon metagenome TaxID=938273 RepID=A0A0W8E548_9ZZZZ